MSKNKQTAGHKGAYTSQKKKEGEPRTCIRYRCGLTNTIQDVLNQRPGWVEMKDDGDWDFNWCDVGWLRENFDHSYMEEHVRICHFRNHYELTRKNLMVKNLKRYRKTLEREAGRLEASKCDFFPCTFVLPSEYHIFVEEFKRSPGSTWIMKPVSAVLIAVHCVRYRQTDHLYVIHHYYTFPTQVARSQGKGIFLFRKLKDIIDWRKDGSRTEEQKDEAQVENYVAQRYIENPYLIAGRKFDLRVYVLVTSYIPLKAWLYRDGFARFSNTRFSLSSIDDQYVHLTNVAVQKTAPDYDPEKGCKWQMQQLRQYLTAKHGFETVQPLFKEIDNIFIRSLLSVQKTIINDKHCFELYGYDILLDQDLKPWLIEVNASPSLTASSQEDYELKYRLLEDTLHIVDMEGRLTGKEKRVGGFDLMWNDGPVYADVGLETLGCSCLVANTHLGCVNDRQKQLLQLLKPFPGQKRI
ncbi:probable tubulin polyglutamylase TTLL9 isoform X1 [Puntigrus tetrazona]|uniref:probable tubulin polyglutamylase TTLL9 isoform X1 n=1 Tax=Puntigrus tetrazona TaxID=1606681 RepID=UPI001C8A29E0|nr:probable tubulin polyglutamylase TTLL9 isoform X1 [Puntigrus tetrazona]